ncbi:hypothetical protein LTR66_011731 [Elasticomyces elasticus]|nr:hypothetical protein LTR66_011731 [Elasticomyces elasticus]
MPEIAVEAQTEPDPSATSIPNDQTLNEAPNADATTHLKAAPTAPEDTKAVEDTTAQALEAASSVESKATATSKTAANETKNMDSISAETAADKPNDAKATSAEKEENHRPSVSAHNRYGRGGAKYRENIKSRNYEPPESDDPDEIRRQVEFYFSDSNLPIDNFLLRKVGGSANNPIDLRDIHSFKRMRRFQPFSTVLEAVKQSEFLEVDEDGMVKRRVPLGSHITDSVEKNKQLVLDRTVDRSIYVKGFGDEEPGTQFDIEAFFAPYGPTNAIRLRRQEPEKVFKGSVFVEFDSVETQQAFMTLEPKPKWNGKELQIMTKKQYVDGKLEDIKEGRVKPKSPRQYGGDGKRRRIDNDDWKARRDDDQQNGRLVYDDGDHKRSGKGQYKGRGRGRGGYYGGKDRRGRRGSPDGRDRRGRSRSRADDEPKPKQKSLQDPTATALLEKSAAADGDGATESKKRAREDDAVAGSESESKKHRSEDTAAAAAGAGTAS